MKHYKYLTCRKCGKEWNVSINCKDGKWYVCPPCRNIKMTLEELKNCTKNHANTEGHSSDTWMRSVHNKPNGKGLP